MNKIFMSTELPYLASLHAAGMYAPQSPPQWMFYEDGDTRKIFISGFLNDTGIEELGWCGYDWILNLVETTDKKIQFFIDSPGGIVDIGLEKILRKILEDRERFSAVVTAQATSAAYLIARACGSLTAIGTTSIVGGVGCYAVYYDTRKFNELLGIVPVLIRVGERKGIGIDGIIDEEEKKYLQEKINELFSEYMKILDGVIPSAWVTGETYTAGSAPAGMVDGIDINTKEGAYVIQNDYDNDDDDIEIGNAVVAGAVGAGAVAHDDSVGDQVSDDVNASDIDSVGDAVCTSDAVSTTVSTETSEVVEASEKPEPVIIPIKMVEDDGDEKIFDELVRRFGSRTRAWSELSRKHPDVYRRLRVR